MYLFIEKDWPDDLWNWRITAFGSISGVCLIMIKADQSFNPQKHFDVTITTTALSFQNLFP
jgi:hypothetical protein